MKKRFEVQTIGFAINSSATPKMVEKIVKRNTSLWGVMLSAFNSKVESLGIGESVKCFCYNGDEFKITRLHDFDSEIIK